MIEFIESTHTYLVDGVIVPSVTTILGATIFNGKYSNVPEFVLNRAREFGVRVHKAVETKVFKGLTNSELHCASEYEDLICRYDILEIEHERIINYGYDYAGTIDLIAYYLGDILADIKTTAKIDLEYVSWQLSFYARALGHKGKLYAIWLNKKGAAELIEVERKTDEQIDEVIKLYEQIKKE